MKQLLIIDDHAALGEALASYLSHMMAGISAKAVPSLADAEGQLSGADLVFLDYHMPEVGDIDRLRAVLERLAPTPIVVFSGDLNPDLVRRCLEIGAAGFVPKTYRHAALCSVIELLLAGQRFVPTEALASALPGLNEQSIDVQEGLSPRERRIGELLCLGLSNKEIARETGLTDGTVKQYLRGLFRKLGVHSRTQAVRLLLRGGPQSSTAAELSAPPPRPSP